MVRFSLEDTGIAPAVDELIHLKAAKEKFGDDCVEGGKTLVFADF